LRGANSKSISENKKTQFKLKYAIGTKRKLNLIQFIPAESKSYAKKTRSILGDSSLFQFKTTETNVISFNF